MRVLWLCNLALPEASILLDEPPSPLGGWIVSAAEYLSHKEGIELSVAFPHGQINTVRMLKGENITYYAFPSVKHREAESCTTNKHLKQILSQSKFDLVHIFGTEYPHSLAMVYTCNEEKIVVSIQGLVSVYQRHYMLGLPLKIQNKMMVKNVFIHDNVEYNHLKQQGNLEIKVLQNVNHVIGRTTWDKACSYQINPNAKYHHCNECLRDEFYNHTWDINQCDKYLIFLSQGSYPIKGLHLMIEAMAIITREFPEAKLYVGGTSPIKIHMERLRGSYYGEYIRNLINYYQLKEKIIFTGFLNSQEMCNQYLKSHVFVSASSIENSPNSLGEAMVLGLPCVASDVGGVTDMMTHKEEGFVYQADAPYMLAHYVCEIFRNSDLALNFSSKASEHALKTHDRETNTARLIEIYHQIMGGGN